jgi:UDP-4-amino-4,6-dideoxy-N-acetyl-beta-L-altrosamine N-acetyltransferase
MSGRLRAMATSDLELVMNWRNHEQTRKFLFTASEITLSQHQQWFAAESINPRRKLLIYEADGIASGFVQFSDVEIGGISEWGFYKAPGAANGIGRSLCEAALHQAFVDLKLHKVNGRVLAGNSISQNLHKQLGFAQEGEQRDQHLAGSGYKNVFLFGLLVTDWTQRMLGKP